MSDLKPCPFCGGEGCVQKHIFVGYTDTFGVVCLDCCCETRQFYKGGMNPEDAYCSVCGFHIYIPEVDNFDDYNFCPDCGAKMGSESERWTEIGEAFAEGLYKALTEGDKQMGKAEYLRKVGARIKAKRREMELTQLQLADLIGYQSKSRNTTINKIETGHSDIPISRLMKFSEVLGLSVKYLLTGEEEHNG